MQSSRPGRSRGEVAIDVVAQVFESSGWDTELPHRQEQPMADLLVRQGRRRFAVEVKSLAEGRPDRVIPLLTQALFQANSYARALGDSQPLAVVCVDDASLSIVKQIDSFFERYAPEMAVGIVTNTGWRYFRGDGLQDLNSQDEPTSQRWPVGAPATSSPVNLFSDLNQWLLKVLLAPDIAEGMLQAPRSRYRSGAELAAAANVSSMSVSRFMQQLRLEEFIDESSHRFVLVRRAELLRRWQAAAARTPVDLPMRFLIKASPQVQIHKLLQEHQREACLGLFAAADALNMGHVSGVPPYILVERLPRVIDRPWRGVTIVGPSEKPDFILRQAHFPKSTFRGAVQRDGSYASDVIQTWLDVANHPSRGREQAEFIYTKHIQSVTQLQ